MRMKLVHGADPKGPGAPIRGPALNSPALLDNAQGKYPEAGPLVKRALAIRGKILEA